MDVDSVKYNVVWQLGQRCFFGAERDQAIDLWDAGCNCEFQSDKSEVMSAAEGFQRGSAVRGDDLGERAGEGWRNAPAGLGKAAIRSRTANDDPFGTGFCGKSEIASVSGAGLKRNDVSWLRPINRRLKIAARGDGDGSPGRRGIAPAVPSAGVARFAILSISASVGELTIGVRNAPQFAITRTEVRNPMEIVRVLLLKVVILLLRVRSFSLSLCGLRS
jgi:hypothetical protein